MKELSDLKVHINGKHTFVLDQRILCRFSLRLRKMARQEEKRSRSKNSGLKLTDFPGGPNGFELVSRFCYSDGRIPTITTSNISLLHCSAAFLEMTKEATTFNLLTQTQAFLDGLFYWSWSEILTSLKSCEAFFSIADSSGLLQRLISSLLSKISTNSEVPLTSPSSSSSSSSPVTPEFRANSSIDTREWWFDDLTILSPNIIEKVMRTLGAYGSDNKSLILTRFLLHYLKKAAHRQGGCGRQYGGLADTAIHGVVLMGRQAFSCRGLFWVLRVVSGLGISRECRLELERLMGLMLDQATLDDLLVSGSDGGVYNVGLVVRLVRVFVEGGEGEMSPSRLKKVGRLMDMYLGEIAPDQRLQASKFLVVAESLPDSARDCFDGVYRALDIYLESHPTLTSEERTRLCRGLNYEKLTLEACKDLAKNPRIPPSVSIEALVSQKSKIQMPDSFSRSFSSAETPRRAAVYTPKGDTETSSVESADDEEKAALRLNLLKMQWRVGELEKVCRDMKSEMSKIGRSRKFIFLGGRGLPWLC